MTKSTYRDASNKRIAREFLVSYFPFNSIVGLPGPDMQDYLQWCKNHGFTEIEAWEYEPIVAINQLSTGINDQISYNVGDIIHTVPDRDNVLYDLDFCATIATLKEHVKRFTKNYIMTFSRRVKGGMPMSQFLDIIGEKCISKSRYNVPMEYAVYKTNKNSEFIRVDYCDSSPMCCIAKIK
jgi:hypothetical protein